MPSPAWRRVDGLGPGGQVVGRPRPHPSSGSSGTPEKLAWGFAGGRQLAGGAADTGALACTGGTPRASGGCPRGGDWEVGRGVARRGRTCTSVLAGVQQLTRSGTFSCWRALRATGGYAVAYCNGWQGVAWGEQNGYLGRWAQAASRLWAAAAVL
jgi:hypothetical protein